MQMLHSYFRSLFFILFCGIGAAQGMEPQKDKQLVATTLAQTYYYFAELLPRELVQHILAFHLDASGVDAS